MADYPRFFSKNYVAPKIVDFENDLSNIVVSDNDSLKRFLFDRNKDTQWESATNSKDDIFQIDSFDDDPIAWVSTDPDVILTRETTIKQEGTASVKFDFTGDWNGGLAAYHNLASELDLSAYNGRRIWRYSPFAPSPTMGLVKLVLSLSLNCATLDKQITFTNAGSATTWYEEIVNGEDFSSLTAVKSIGIYDSSPTGIDDYTFYLDDLRITQDPKTAEVEFYEGSVAIDRTFNTLFLQNINLKEFKLQYEDSGGSWADISETAFTNNSQSRVLAEFSDVTSGRVRLVMNKTITANQPKKVGEFWLLNNLYDLTDAMDTYSPSTLQDSASIRLASFNDSLWWLAEKYRTTVGLKRITLTELNELKAIYDTHKPFVWYPEPESRPDEIYLVTWKSPWSEPYSSKYKGLGYDVRMSLEEV